MHCKLVSELDKLRKRAPESVENTASFSAMKQYLHVRRPVEDELKRILASAQQSGTRKHLVLLCGSAGDGKSHLISYLRNSDPEHLLDGYIIDNDATESDGPQRTSADRLSDLLRPFDDEHLNDGQTARIIVAINLGTLSNFIESDYGDRFQGLKHYVEVNEILTESMAGGTSAQSAASCFDHVNFSEYPAFSFDADGAPDTTILEQMLGKVLDSSSRNPFATAYHACGQCPHASRCPVKHNYEYLQNFNRRKYVASRVVEACVMDKVLVSARDFLAFIADIIAPLDFNQSALGVQHDESFFLQKYLEWTTPMLLNCGSGVSPLLEAVRQHSPTRNRSVLQDSLAVDYHSSPKRSLFLQKETSSTPYAALRGRMSDANARLLQREPIGMMAYNFIIFCKDVDHKIDTPWRDNLRRFLEYIYWYQSGNARKLQPLCIMAEKAMYSLNGCFGENEICSSASNEHLWVLREVSIQGRPCSTRPRTSGPVDKFSLHLDTTFSDDDTSDKVKLRIDYALFELMERMTHGYVPSSRDKNRHPGFVNAVEKLSNSPRARKKATLVYKDSEEKHDVVLSWSDSFGSLRVGVGTRTRRGQ